MVALSAIRARRLDDEDVTGRDAAIFLEAHAHPALVAGPRASDVGFLFARNAHHHGAAVELLRQERRNRHRLRTGNLAAEPAAGELADQHDLFGFDSDPAGDRRHRAGHALRRAVQVELAVLPVGHGRPRLEWLVPGGLLIVVALDDEVGFREPLLDIAEHQRLRGFRVVRELAFGDRGGLRGRPLERLQRGTDEHVALGAAIRAAGLQRVEGIDDEGQRLILDDDLLDRGRRQFLRLGSHGHDGLALVERLLGQSHLGRHGGTRRRGGRCRGGCTRGRRSRRTSRRSCAGGRRSGCTSGRCRRTRSSGTGRCRRRGRRRGRWRGRHVISRQHCQHTRHGQRG